VGHTDVVQPSELTESGELCVRRLAHLQMQVRSGDPLPSLAVVSIVAIVEAHNTRVLDALAAISGIRDTVVGSTLYDRAEDDLRRSWDSRMSWLRKAFDVSVAGSSQYQSFCVLIELRNTLVHGDGRLTDFQVRTILQLLVLRRNLRSVLDVDCVGRNVVLGQRTIGRAFRVAREFVCHFDRILISKQAGLVTYPLMN
jgi:hypothetical protein